LLAEEEPAICLSQVFSANPESNGEDRYVSSRSQNCTNVVYIIFLNLARHEVTMDKNYRTVDNTDNADIEEMDIGESYERVSYSTVTVPSK
jgi:hypothetical protein